MSKITEEQRQYIIDHIDDYPRYKVAKDAGVNMRTMYRVIRAAGGKISPPQSEQHKEIVTRLWATHSAAEIKEETGLSGDCVMYWVKKLNLKHSQATEERIRKKSLDAANKALLKESVREKRAASWKRTRKLDYIRFIGGQKQNTKFKFAKYPERIHKAIWKLENIYGYFQDEEAGGYYTMYYDEQTKRTPMEHLYIKRYGLKFEQA